MASGLGILLILAGFPLFGLYLLAIVPRDRWSLRPSAWGRFVRDLIVPQWVWLTPLILLAVLHWTNLNFVDGPMREWVLSTGFNPLEWILAVEGNAVRSLQALHGPVQDFLFTWFYMVFHHALVVGLPLFMLGTREFLLARRLALSTLVVFLFSLPGFLFLPADNPHVYFGDPLVLERGIPGILETYYRGTSIDNTFPSLHNGFAMVLLLHAWESTNPRLKWSVAVYAPLLAFSTVYLQVHWYVDIVGGIITGTAAWAFSRWAVPRLQQRWMGAATATNDPS